MKKDFIANVRSIEGWLSDHEALLLYSISRSAPDGDIVEIGSWKGKSTVCLGLGRKDMKKPGKVYAVDPHKGELTTDKRKKLAPTYVSFLRTLSKWKLTDRVVPVVKTSKAAARSWEKPVSFLFIDGIHDYNHAREDFRLWNNLVVDGGFIAFHDCFCGIYGVMKAADEYFLPWDRLTDLGTVGSILYGKKGRPNILQKIIVLWKRTFIRLAQKLDQAYDLPERLRMTLVHKVLRLFFITKETLAVYV